MLTFNLNKGKYLTNYYIRVYLYQICSFFKCFVPQRGGSAGYRKHRRDGPESCHEGHTP